MITNTSCRKSLALIFLFIHSFIQASSAQLRIDTSLVPTGILWKSSPLLKAPPTSGDTIDFHQGWQAMKSLMNSRLNTDGLGITERMKAAEWADEKVNTIVLFPTVLNYQEIDGSHPEYFDHLENEYFVLEDFRDSVYRTKTSFFVSLSEEMIRSKEVHFVISEQSLWTNMAGSFMVDFDDGNGWMNWDWDSPKVVFYDNEWVDRLIRFRFNTGSEILVSASLLKGNAVHGCDLLPHSPPWMEDPELPWRIDADYEGSSVAGNAYTLWSDDGVLDKPFVFVEGIDFNLQQWDGQLGDFGWCQFMGHDEVNYPMLAQSAQMVDSLREMGYDLVLLDFVDGAADIRRNAALLKHLIQLCNAYKEGQHQLIVAGASMGGQVARVALAEMERDGLDHCAGVYISWDSPHQGAHIPLSIQTAIDFLAPFSAEAEAFKNGALLRPAAQQMLIHQYFDPMGSYMNPSAFHSFQMYMDEISMPRKTINWAIANGSGIGTPLETPAWTPLLETECNASNLFPGVEFRMNLFAAPGNPDHSASTETLNVISDLIYSETYSGLLSFAFVEYSGVYSINNATPALDFRPGGFRTSVKELVDVVNENADYLALCSSIGTDEYALKHSFISPQSALNFHGNDDIGILDALVLNPESTPFDQWYVPPGDNQPHVAMTPQNIQWLLHHISALDEGQSLSISLGCSPYQIGAIGEDYLFPITIHGTQEVVLNGGGPFHCGEENLTSIPMKKMELLPQCNQLGFVLKDKSILRIGSPDGAHRCQLKLKPGSSIRMQDKSRLVLQLGSQLIVGPEAKLILDDMSTLTNMGGEIIVQEGGQIIYNGFNFSLEHEEAKLIFQDGTMHIAPSKALSLQPITGATGSVEVQSTIHPCFGFGNGSKLILTGNSREDDVLKLDTSSVFYSMNDANAAISIQNGAVQFMAHATWNTGCFVQMNKVKLYSLGAYENEQNDVVFENNKVLMQACLWHHLSFKGDQAHLRASQTRCMGNEVLNWKKGSLTVNESDMLGVGWVCQSIGLPFSFHGVTFSGNGNGFGLEVTALDNVPLIIESCDFSDYQTGIKQTGGALKIACSRFEQLSSGVDIENGVQLTMNEGAGKSAFLNNGRHLVMNEVPAPALVKGGNWFGASEEYSVAGLLALDPSEMMLDWSGNQWDTQQYYVETYFNNAPNDLYLNPLQLEPMMAFQPCGGQSSDYKLAAMGIDMPMAITDESANARYSLYDLSGRILGKDLTYHQYISWRVSPSAASGVYILTEKQGEEIQIEKVMIP
jgi:hypothetical protein